MASGLLLCAECQLYKVWSQNLCNKCYIKKVLPMQLTYAEARHQKAVNARLDLEKLKQKRYNLMLTQEVAVSIQSTLEIHELREASVNLHNMMQYLSRLSLSPQKHVEAPVSEAPEPETHFEQAQEPEEEQEEIDEDQPDEEQEEIDEEDQPDEEESLGYQTAEDEVKPRYATDADGYAIIEFPDEKK